MYIVVETKQYYMKNKDCSFDVNIGGVADSGDLGIQILI